MRYAGPGGIVPGLFTQSPDDGTGSVRVRDCNVLRWEGDYWTIVFDGKNEAPVLLGYGQQLIAERLISGWRPTHRLAATRPQVNESTRERLRALGYVD